MTPLPRLLACCLLLLLLPLAHAAPPTRPVPEDPLLATISGVAAEGGLLPADDVPTVEYEYVRYPWRSVPDVLWFAGTMRYTVAAQPGAAPLAFVIAGTGADADSSSMRTLRRALYQAGWHVVTVPSPTHASFIVAASQRSLPGYLFGDVDDLYAVLQDLRERLAGQLQISTVDLVGFSLGGTQAGLLAARDAQEHRLGLHRVVLVNPAVSLWNSVSRLDALLEDNIPGGLAHFDVFVDDIFERFAAVYSSSEDVTFDAEFVFHTLGRGRQVSDAIGALIGAAFRLSEASMLFVADVMRDAGFLKPAGYPLQTSDSLSGYLRVSAGVSFRDYVRRFLLPQVQRERPALTLDRLIDESSLMQVGGFLRRSPDIGVVTNADDIILGRDEVDWLRTTFGRRARIHAHGGHGGNLARPEFLADVIALLGGPRTEVAHASH